MFKKLYLHQGIHVATAIAIITVIPKLIRFDDVNLLHILYQLGFTTFFSLSIWIICQFFLNNKFIKNRIVKIVYALIIGTIISFLLQLLGDLFLDEIATENTKFGILFNLSKQQVLSMFLFRGLTFTGLTYFIAYNLSLSIEKQKNQLEIEQLKQENLEAKLSLLKQQVSPHFLFNSLSTLKTIVTDRQSKDYIIELSKVYRYLLDNDGLKQSNLISLKEELDFTHSYLYILKERFEDGLKVETKVADGFLEMKLPPLALQILIENAIKHNIVSFDEPLEIQISTDDDKYLVVKNNLQLKQSTEDSLGIGLQNIKDRYLLIENKEIIIENNEESFIVKLPLIKPEAYVQSTDNRGRDKNCKRFRITNCKS